MAITDILRSGENMRDENEVRVAVRCMDYRLNPIIADADVVLSNAGANAIAMEKSLVEVFNKNRGKKIVVDLYTHTTCGGMGAIAKALQDKTHVDQYSTEGIIYGGVVEPVKSYIEEHYSLRSFKDREILEEKNPQIQQQFVEDLARKHGANIEVNIKHVDMHAFRVPQGQKGAEVIITTPWTSGDYRDARAIDMSDRGRAYMMHASDIEREVFPSTLLAIKEIGARKVTFMAQRPEENVMMERMTKLFRESKEVQRTLTDVVLMRANDTSSNVVAKKKEKTSTSAL